MRGWEVRFLSHSQEFPSRRDVQWRPAQALRSAASRAVTPSPSVSPLPRYQIRSRRVARDELKGEHYLVRDLTDLLSQPFAFSIHIFSLPVSHDAAHVKLVVNVNIYSIRCY
jgi:hypothetical protein